MKQVDRREICRDIKHELQKGIHTFTMCDCGRHGCRSGKCWECLVDEIYIGKRRTTKQGSKG